MHKCGTLALKVDACCLSTIASKFSRMRLLYLVLAWGFCTLIRAAPPVNIHARDLPIPPSEDPFYNPPAGFEDAELGAILRMRKKQNPYGVVTFEADVKAVYQVLVRSEDTFKQPIAVMSTIFVPHNANSSRLLSYQVAEDSAQIDCSPSYAMQLYSNPRTYITGQIELLLVVAALEKGWYVVVPDHEGPKSTYIAGWLAGYAVLNLIKAALHTGNSTGIDPDAEVALWGYSGGSLGSGWGAQLQPTYYPELNLVGAAYGGIIVDIQHIAEYTMGTIFAGLVISAISAISNEYPSLKQLIKEKVRPDMYEDFTRAQNFCLAEEVAYYAFAEWSDYIDEGAQILQDPIVLNITDQNNMLMNGMVPECPLFFYASEEDEILPVNDTHALYNHFCEQGASVTMKTDYISEHIIAAVSGAGLAFNFLQDRFNGVPAPQECSLERSVSSVFDTGSIAGLGEVGTAILDILGNGTTSSEFFSTVYLDVSLFLGAFNGAT